MARTYFNILTLEKRKKSIFGTHGYAVSLGAFLRVKVRIDVVLEDERETVLSRSDLVRIENRRPICRK